MGGALLLAAWIMYNFDEEEAFRKAQESQDTEHAVILPSSVDEAYHADQNPDAFTPGSSSMETPQHGEFETHGTLSHRATSSTVSSSTL